MYIVKMHTIIFLHVHYIRNHHKSHLLDQQVVMLLSTYVDASCMIIIIITPCNNAYVATYIHMCVLIVSFMT